MSDATITNLIRACVIKKDNAITDKVFEQASPQLRDSLTFQAELTRAFLSCGDYYSGMRLVKEFISRGLTNNDTNNILLEGLAEGRFFQECIRLYQLIMVEREKNSSICLYSHGYAAVIRSACQLKRRPLAEDLFNEMKERRIPIPDVVYFEMCDVIIDENFDL